MYEKPVWQMVKEAVTAIGGSSVSNAQIRDYIFDHYGAVNQGTINAQIIVCCVNRQSRINFPENHKPRTADGQYDFLYYVDRGLVTLYDPDRHGKWEIALQDGKPVVRRIDSSSSANIPSKLENEPTAIAHTSQRRDRLNHDIESPNRDIVKRYLEKWETLENYTAQERALNRLFGDICPQNTKLEDVLIKVATLNAFYSTNIYNVFQVARHIVKLNIDERLRRGDESLVMDIASGHGVVHGKSGKELSFYSFATKYCSHHNPEAYPIYDSFVEEFLVYLSKVDSFAVFRREDLRDITIFKRVLMKLRDFYGLQEFSLKQIDQYLWQYGKEKFPKSYGRKKVRNENEIDER
jgi:hypothetical protein